MTSGTATSGSTSSDDQGASSASAAAGSSSASASSSSGDGPRDGYLLITEVVDGTAFNRAVELSNPGDLPVDLATFRLATSLNGGMRTSISLSGTVAPGGSFVVCHGTAGTALAPRCNMLAVALDVDGNDTIQLFEGVQLRDAFGDGTSTGWQGSAGMTVRRKCSVSTGVTTLSPPFVVANEWDAFPQDTFGDLGSYACTPMGPVGSASSSSTASSGAASSGGQALRPGETCATAEVLMLTEGTTTFHHTTDSYTRDHEIDGSMCAWMIGKDRVYSVAIPAGATLDVSVVAADARYDPGLNILPAGSACQLDSPCIDSRRAEQAPTVNSIRLVNEELAATSVLVVVSSYDVSSGPYTLAFTLTLASSGASSSGGGSSSSSSSGSVPPAGDRCRDAPEYVLSQTLRGEDLAGFGPDYFHQPPDPDILGPDLLPYCQGLPGTDRTYFVEVPGNSALRVHAEFTGTVINALEVLRGDQDRCGEATPTCLANATSATPENEVWFYNGSSQPQPAFVIVDTDLPAPPAAVDLALEAFPMTPRVGDDCTRAVPVTADVLNETNRMHRDDFHGDADNCAFVTGPDRVYRVAVPLRGRLVATVLGDPRQPTPTVTLLERRGVDGADQCRAQRCLTSSRNGWTHEAGVANPPGASTVRHYNLTQPNQEVLVVVDGTVPQGQFYDLLLKVEQLQSGENAVVPTPITGATQPLTYNGSTEPFRADISCGAGRDRFYAVDLTPGQTLDVTVASLGFDGEVSLALRPRSSITETVECLAGANAEAGHNTVSITWDEAREAAYDKVLIVVNGTGPLEYGDYRFEVWVH